MSGPKKDVDSGDFHSEFSRIVVTEQEFEVGENILGVV
jgi:hypothetical protein